MARNYKILGVCRICKKYFVVQNGMQHAKSKIYCPECHMKYVEQKIEVLQH